MNNMTNEQIERWLQIQEDKNEQLGNISWNLSAISEAISGAYNGDGKSAFWGMSQALFTMIGADGDRDGALQIKIVKDEE